MPSFSAVSFMPISSVSDCSQRSAMLIGASAPVEDIWFKKFW
jgi:hypothetical protein